MSSTNQQPTTQPNNPQKLQQDYTYNPDLEVKTVEEQQQQQQDSKTSEDALKEMYPEQIRNLAQSKVFNVEFIDGNKKMFMRREPSMGEVATGEEYKQEMFQYKGPNSKMYSKVMLDYYEYASSIHLRETKTGAKLTRQELENVKFSKFKMIIDACEYAALFNPN